MEIRTITVTCGCKRSANYQSVDVSVTAEVALGPGETMEKVFADVKDRLVPLVETAADAYIREVVRQHSLG